MILDKNFVDAAEGKTYFILNYGCQMNESDAEHYAGQLEEMGYAKADDFHNADIIVVNTCCVRESAEKRILGKIGELKRVKENHPGQVICVAGCMAQKDGEKLIKKHPQIDLLIGTAHVNSFKEILTDFLADKGGRIYDDMIIADSEFEGNRVRQSGFSAWIPIMYGCNNFCTYCIVPYVRGRERSRSIENIVEEVEQAVANGYKEFTLLGQNVNSYGKDFGEKGMFAKLLRRVNDVPGVERIRYMTSHPRDMGEDVIQAVAECEHVCENFHVPFQAGSSRILKMMNRGYTREQYLELVKMIRRYVPDAAVTTDIIVGFPGETEEDFEETLDVVRKAKYDSAYTFIYSKRTGTPAAAMENQVPEDVVKNRFNRLLETVNEVSRSISNRYEGTVQQVLVEDVDDHDASYVTGRMTNNILVHFPGSKDLIGTLVNVRLTECRGFYYMGEQENA